jgi:hypothetical protein
VVPIAAPRSRVDPPQGLEGLHMQAMLVVGLGFAQQSFSLFVFITFYHAHISLLFNFDADYNNPSCTRIQCFSYTIDTLVDFPVILKEAHLGTVYP